MANEAVMVDRTEEPLSFVCAAGVAITKGTIARLSGARTAQASVASGEVALGITARDKIAGDGRTSVGVFLGGVARCASDTVIAIGAPVAISGANIIRQAATLDVDTGEVLGRALEAAGSSPDNIEVLLGHGGA